MTMADSSDDSPHIATRPPSPDGYETLLDSDLFQNCDNQEVLDTIDQLLGYNISESVRMPQGVFLPQVGVSISSISRVSLKGKDCDRRRPVLRKVFPAANPDRGRVPCR